MKGWFSLKNKAVDIVCLCIVGALFGTAVMLNLIQPNRPVESLTEQRKLAEMPEFTWESLADGSFFAGVSEFISDTFIYRDQIVGVSKKMDTLRGVDYQIAGNDSFVLLDATSSKDNNNAEHDELSDKLAQALQDLNNNGKSDDQSSGIDNDDIKLEDTSTATDDMLDYDEPGMIILPEDEMPDDPWNEYLSPDDSSINDPSSDDNYVEPVGEETSDDTEASETTAPEVTAIHLSRDSLRLTIGSGAVVYATVDTVSGEGSANVSWSISDKSIANISINPQGGIDVKGIANGKCTLTCSYSDTIKETCEITVSEIITTAPTENLEADFLTGGMFIYGDAVYVQGDYIDSAARNYAQTALYYKQLFGEDVNVSVVVAPVSAMVIDNEEIKSKIADQEAVLDKMGAVMDSSINFVDTYDEMYEHRDEYLFFKSDHHWTQRGAYYAYRAFAKSLGLEPTALDDFDYEVRNDEYHGSLYNMTHDERVKNFIDKVEVFNSRKPHTMTITTSNGTTINTNNSIVATHKTYLTFISGDNPYTVINVPENPQDKNILVLKDSFGNAFVPFLCEHFGNIIVVDVRYTSMNVYDQLKDYGLTDIVFVNNMQAANSSSWSKMYLTAVGVN